MKLELSLLTHSLSVASPFLIVLILLVPAVVSDGFGADFETSGGRSGASGAASPYRVAVHAPGGVPKGIAAGLKASGASVTLLPGDRLDASGPLTVMRFDAILFADAARAPIRDRDTLLAFLKAGGDMIVAGGPFFERSIRLAEAEWESALQRVPASHSIFTFADGAEASWERGTDRPALPIARSVVPSGEKGGTPADDKSKPLAMRVEITELGGWETLSRNASEPFPGGNDLTIFRAKGGPRTRAMSVEWMERDGSRWIASVPLSTRWKRYVLSPEDFAYWQDNVSKGRGGSGDRFRPSEATRLSVGLARTHGAFANGAHSYVLGEIGSGKRPAGLTRPDTAPPALELFSPFYKYYRLPSLRPTAKALQASAATGNATGPVTTPIPRPRGLGMEEDRKSRWIPLDDILDETGNWRGTRSSIFLNLAPPYRGSVWGQIAGASSDAEMARTVARVVRVMRREVVLANAGAGEFSYFLDEAIPLGARVASFAKGDRTVEPRIRVTRKGETGPLFRATKSIAATAGGTGRADWEWRPVGAKPGIYTVTVELAGGNGVVLDTIEQEITLLDSVVPPRGEFVSVRDGEFVAPPSPGQPSRRWHPYGVNYWQSNVAGADPAEYWLHWLAPGYYDPRIVERDLTRMKAMGFTAVSIQLNRPGHVRQVNDFVARAARHGIRTNLFLAGAHPFQTDEALYTGMVRAGRFAANPDIWAYDIAWEHHLGNQAERSGWDREWEEWVIDRYGSIEHAERVWGFPIPRAAGGTVTNPPDDQLRNDGPWLRMAVAYERAADDIISRRYGRVIRTLRGLDPNHLVSARSATQPSWTSWFAYDLASTGKHFDFSSPEGYGLDPKEAGFTTSYARWAGKGKPVFWSEFGLTIFPYDNGEKAALQADLHRGFAEMTVRSGASGLSGWWSVGGYRVDEKSDYGVFGPDGTPRGSALALAKLAKAMTAPRALPEPEWVTIDRDLHASGYQAVYETHAKAYEKAARDGRILGVRTDGTGSDSAGCPLTAVGNVAYDGFAPLKFLNAEFNRVEIRVREGGAGTGEWREVVPGTEVRAPAGATVEARVSAGNTGEASWLSRGGTGSVRLIGDDRPDARGSSLPRLRFEASVPRDVSRHEDIEIGPFPIASDLADDSEAVLAFEAVDRARFGERFRITVRVGK